MYAVHPTTWQIQYNCFLLIIAAGVLLVVIVEFGARLAIINGF